jgi:hypothetical protein
VRRNLFCLWLLALSSISGAVICGEAWPGNAPPYYFSGTNSRAGMWAAAEYPAAWIHSYTITLEGGGVTKSFSRTLPDPVDPIEGPFPIARPIFMFDSTGFEPGCFVSVTIDAVDNLGGTGTYTTEGVKVRNFALVCSHPEVQDVPAVVMARLEGPYTCFGEPDDWTCRNFVEDMAGVNVVSYSGHGTPSSFWAAHVWIDQSQNPAITYETHINPWGDDTYVIGHPGWLNGCSVEHYRGPQMGSGLPPFNSTENPPINLATIVNCATGSNQNFIRFCIPYLNAFGIWLEDQAYFGFIPSIYLYDEAGINAELYKSLMAGKVLYYAREDLIAAGYRSFPDGSDPGHVMTAADMAIYGDQRMRLTTVYTRDYRSPYGWYIMPIPPPDDEGGDDN